MPGAAGKENHLSLFQVFPRLPHVVAFPNALDVNRRHHPGVHTALAEHVGDRKAVHGRGQHAHAVGADALDFPGTVLDAAPEVSAADHNADLGPEGKPCTNLLAYTGDKGEVIPGPLFSGQRLSADFNQNAMILHTHSGSILSRHRHQVCSLAQPTTLDKPF